MNQIVSPNLPGTRLDPRHPDSDGRFLGETDFHSLAQIWLREGLEDHFASAAVYIASNLIYYYEQGQPRARKDPDILVAKGVGKHRRRSYRLWEERVIPSTFFELASRRTWRVDLHEKRLLYAKLRIKEYFIFDPQGRYLQPVLQGFRGRGGDSRPMKAAADGSLVSKELGLRLQPAGGMLRLLDLQTGTPILTRAERLEQERERAEQLAAEVARLRHLLRRQGHRG